MTNEKPFILFNGCHEILPEDTFKGILEAFERQYGDKVEGLTHLLIALGTDEQFAEMYKNNPAWDESTSLEAIKKIVENEIDEGAAATVSKIHQKLLESA